MRRLPDGPDGSGLPDQYRYGKTHLHDPADKEGDDVQAVFPGAGESLEHTGESDGKGAADREPAD